MASIFTFITEPPKVLSPWPTQIDPQKLSPHTPFQGPPISLANYGIRKLEPEPHSGPVEYKLHLLLRPRRQYNKYSTGLEILKSQENPKVLDPPSLNCLSSAPSTEFRQKRFQQLTTQLLWRLQQSSPNHTSSISQIILPKLADATDISKSLIKPGKLVTGLEESHGALYEIGVSDDGNFVGLTKDEMEESLLNLRVMAASIGCDVIVTQMILVGNCEWPEISIDPKIIQSYEKSRSSPASAPPLNQPELHRADLLVAEALITPHLTPSNVTTENVLHLEACGQTEKLLQQHLSPPPDNECQTTEQLRCTLIGPTGSGKSSILGNLCTANLDNGRGKIRGVFLKHPHEVESGVTNSIAQELIGYKGLEVINYASGNVTSWTDIHASARNERVVFLSDCPGNSKQHRATIRGLIDWAPHWNMLCVAADNSEDIHFGKSESGSSLSTAKDYLELCLKLDTPLAVVITKLDLASKSNLRSNLSKILSALKATGRTPVIFPPEQQTPFIDPELTIISPAEKDFAEGLVDSILNSGNLNSTVPIVMSSAVKGTGIRSLHAILRYLPLTILSKSIGETIQTRDPKKPVSLFHINDTFCLPKFHPALSHASYTGIIFSGHLQAGRIFVGNEVLIGPFLIETDNADLRKTKRESHEDISVTCLADAMSKHRATCTPRQWEWHKAEVVSVHNLRLPVRMLEAGQVGTVGIVWKTSAKSETSAERPMVPKVRKGMVLAIPSEYMCQHGYPLQATKRFIASFTKSEVKSLKGTGLAIIHTSSIRASARFSQSIPGTQVNTATQSGENTQIGRETDGCQSLLNALDNSEALTDILIELVSNREWIEPNSQVLLVLRDKNEYLSGPEKDEMGGLGQIGFVGKIKAVLD
ncbi:hypothetical protein K3495_g5980 [Podosphaera aphanis]|nr:hypothetical protein K3495_g5980 [Podosphaera aphanis]